MNKKNELYHFINVIRQKKLLTLFIKNIFGYKNFHDYNYIFRVINEKEQVIIDIYDNISDNRFNRYIFDFGISNNESNYSNSNVFVTYINVLRTEKPNNKLEKLGYLFMLDGSEKIAYAATFLDKDIVEILKK